jgi:hypothetical protein
MAQSVWMAIHDDQTGLGVKLAFPTMSTCAAIIVRLQTTLVGIHKTEQWNNTKNKLFNEANGLINGAPILDLHILAWNVNDNTKHDTAQIQNTLNCNNVPCYTFNYSNKTATSFQAPRSFGNPVSDLCTFAEFQTNSRPKFHVKRTTKVTATRDQNAYTNFVRANGGFSQARYLGFDETIDANHWHPIKNSDFT